MKKLKLSFIALCLSVISAQAQVVFSENEQNYVASIATHAPTASIQKTVAPNQSDKLQLSDIGSNWFASVKLGTLAFVGSPQGCGDLYDKITPHVQTSIGKWHSPFFGTRLAFEGGELKVAAPTKQCFQNFHLDMMLNASSFYHKDYEQMPKWNIIPYVGTGVIKNTTLHQSSFAVNYGVICSYRMANHLSITAEIGTTSCQESFDGLGDSKRLNEHLIKANIGLTWNLGKQGWKKKNLKTIPFYQPSPVQSQTQYPKNNYRGLQELQKRMQSARNSESATLSKGFDAPILFFFKINTTHLIDSQQKVEIAEIAAAVKEYDFKVKVIGAADSRTGKPEYNRKLSIKRAKYIAKLLIEAGVPKDKLSGVSQGGIDIYRPYTANRHTCVILQKEESSSIKQ